MKEPEVPDFVPEYLSDPIVNNLGPDLLEKEYQDGTITTIELGPGGDIETLFADGSIHYDHSEDEGPLYIPADQEDIQP